MSAYNVQVSRPRPMTYESKTPTSGGRLELMVMCLDALMQTLKETGHTCETKRVIDVFYEVKGEKRPIASIYPDDKYVSFHDEFTQLGIDVPGMRDLLCNGGWDSNHT